MKYSLFVINPNSGIIYKTDIREEDFFHSTEYAKEVCLRLIQESCYSVFKNGGMIRLEIGFSDLDKK